MTVIFIGDEVTASGYRLAGADARVTASDDAAAALRRARDERPSLILLTAELAESIDVGELEAALTALAPLLLLVPDAAGRVPVPDLAARVRAAIGVAE